MNKIISVMFFMTLWSASANAANKSEREAFYTALSNMSSDLAIQTFTLDELLTDRCGKAPSIQYLKTTVMSSTMPLSLALKSGNITEAKAHLSSITCEKQ